MKNATSFVRNLVPIFTVCVAGFSCSCATDCAQSATAKVNVQPRYDYMPLDKIPQLYFSDFLVKLTGHSIKGTYEPSKLVAEMHTDCASLYWFSVESQQNQEWATQLLAGLCENIRSHGIVVKVEQSDMRGYIYDSEASFHACFPQHSVTGDFFIEFAVPEYDYDNNLWCVGISFARNWEDSPRDKWTKYIFEGEK